MTRVDMDLLPALSWPFGCFQFLFRWMWPFHLVLHCQRTAVGSRLRCLWLSGQVCAAFVMRGRTGRHLGCTQRTDSETLSLVLFWWRAHNATADVRYAEPRVYRPHPSAECGVAGRSGPPAGAFPPGLLQRRVGAVTRTKRSWPQQPKHTAEEGKKEAKMDEEAVLAPHGAGGMLSASSQTPSLCRCRVGCSSSAVCFHLLSNEGARKRSAAQGGGTGRLITRLRCGRSRQSGGDCRRARLLLLT